MTILVIIICSFVASSCVFSLTIAYTKGEPNELNGSPKYSQNEDNSRLYQYLTTAFKVDINGSNEDIVLLGMEGSSRNSSFFAFWNDPNNSCGSNFKCVTNFSTGWHDNASIQISTTSSENMKWSSIYGKEVPVKSNERYALVTHLKHNYWSTQSHVQLHGFNET